MAGQEALYPLVEGTLDAIPFHLLNESILGNLIKIFSKIYYYDVCLLVIPEVVDGIMNKGEEFLWIFFSAEIMLKVIEDVIFL